MRGAILAAALLSAPLCAAPAAAEGAYGGGPPRVTEVRAGAAPAYRGLRPGLTLEDARSAARALPDLNAAPDPEPVPERVRLSEGTAVGLGVVAAVEFSPSLPCPPQEWPARNCVTLTGLFAAPDADHAARGPTDAFRLTWVEINLRPASPLDAAAVAAAFTRAWRTDPPIPPDALPGHVVATAADGTVGTLACAGAAGEGGVRLLTTCDVVLEDPAAETALLAVAREADRRARAGLSPQALRLLP